MYCVLVGAHYTSTLAHYKIIRVLQKIYNRLSTRHIKAGIFKTKKKFLYVDIEIYKKNMLYDQIFLQPQLITDKEFCCIIITNVFSRTAKTFCLSSEKIVATKRKVTYGFKQNVALSSEFKPNRNVSKNSKF
jgi:hypothetical protein